MTEEELGKVQALILDTEQAMRTLVRQLTDLVTDTVGPLIIRLNAMEERLAALEKKP